MVAQSAVVEREQLAFDFLPDLPVIVQQHHGQLSSDAGLLPLRQFDQRRRYTDRLSACLHDPNPRPHPLPAGHAPPAALWHPRRLRGLQ